MKLSSKSQVITLPANITRIVALGDPHGEVKALQTVLAKEMNPHTFIVSMGDNIGYADAEECSRLITILRDNQIPSVWGNHEDWSEDSGRLFLISNPAAPRILSKEAVEWCQKLPHQIRLQSDLTPLSIRIQHSIHDLHTEAWDWITQQNVAAFAQKVPGDVVFTGHSHSARIYTLGRAAGQRVLSRCQQLKTAQEEPMIENIIPGYKYVVDAGSLSRPNGGAAPFDRGSYAVMDLVQKTVQIQAFKK